MGYCKNMWIDENEAIAEQFLDDEITEKEFTDRMKSQGFDPDEISDMVSAIEEDK